MINPGQPSDEVTLQAAFEAFHAANPRIYEVLETLAAEWLANHSKVGVKMLWERARWEFGVQSTESAAYRLNNNFVSRYARKLLADHPEWADRIETRVLRAA